MEEVPLTITETDVVDPKLLLRFQRKVVDRLGGLSQRVSAVENAKTPLPLGQIKQGLEAGGGAPLNLDNLLGTTAQPQLARAPRLSSVPADLILQQYKDEQLILIQSTSTGYDLYTVVAGNPTTLSRLISGLSTASSVGSTSTNFMTLDTTQTSTGSKVLQGQWYFTANTMFATSTAEAPQKIVHMVGPDGPVAAFPTLGLRDFVVIENNQNCQMAFVKSTASVNAGFRVYISGGATVRSFFLENTDIWTLNANGTQVFAGSSAAFNPNVPVKIDQTISNYHGLNTAGEGIPYILARTAVTAVSTAVSPTILYTTTATGEYRINYYISPTTTGTLGGVQFAAQWTDQKETKTKLGALIAMSAGQLDQGALFFHSASGATIQMATNVGTSTVAPLGTYSVYVVLERLS